MERLWREIIREMRELRRSELTLEEEMEVRRMVSQAHRESDDLPTQRGLSLDDVIRRQDIMEVQLDRLEETVEMILKILEKVVDKVEGGEAGSQSSEAA